MSKISMEQAALSRVCAHLDEPVTRLVQALDRLRSLVEQPGPYLDAAYWKGVIATEAGKAIAAVSP